MRYVLPTSLTWWAGLAAILIGLCAPSGPAVREAASRTAIPMIALVRPEGLVSPIVCFNTG